jgi:hypothetical protein
MPMAVTRARGAPLNTNGPSTYAFAVAHETCETAPRHQGVLVSKRQARRNAGLAP